jgi:hypothetical protein
LNSPSTIQIHNYTNLPASGWREHGFNCPNVPIVAVGFNGPYENWGFIPTGGGVLDLHTGTRSNPLLPPGVMTCAFPITSSNRYSLPAVAIAVTLNCLESPITSQRLCVDCGLPE